MRSSVSSEEILILREFIELFEPRDENVELKVELLLDTLLVRVFGGLKRDDKDFPGLTVDIDRPDANPVIALRTIPERTFKLGVNEWIIGGGATRVRVSLIFSLLSSWKL